MLLNRIYYRFKPLIPRQLQIFVRRKIAAYKRKKYASVWPIDPSAGKAPTGWQGWPKNKKFALVLAHDVDTKRGYDQVLQLAELEQSLGFRSSFNFVPERYGEVSADLRQNLVNRGFAVNVHGLKHDGRLFETKRIFTERAKRINYYIKQWNTQGFTAPSMHRNLDWMHLLNIKYSTSTFDTDPFEPQSDGAGTTFPFWVQNHHSEKGFVELRYTLPQDHAVFIIMQEKDAAVWKQKLDWIVKKGAMALCNTHPDYMNFDENNFEFEQYPVKFYQEFLNYIKNRYTDQYWNALPSEVAAFWKSAMLRL